MSSTPIRIERAPPVVRITLQRPERRNALNQDLVRSLTAALIELRTDESVRVVILTGSGTAFSAGADLDSLRGLQSASRVDNEADSRRMAELFQTIYTHPKVVVARVNGHAIAGGCGLVAAADFAVGVETARLGFTEVRIGFVPAIVSAVLVRKLRGTDVRRLFLSGELIDAPEAVRIGLLHAAVPAESLDAAVDELAATVARDTSPTAIRMTKDLLANVTDLSFNDALVYAAEMNVAARSTDDCRAGVAAFLEKKAPPWKAAAEAGEHE